MSGREWKNIFNKQRISSFQLYHLGIALLVLLVLLSGCYFRNTHIKGYPIIYVHGHNSYASNIQGWRTFYIQDDGHIYPTVLTDMIGYSGYGWGKTKDGKNTLYCTKNTPLKKMQYPLCIYNFSYYSNGREGAIGSNGRLKCLVALHKKEEYSTFLGIPAKREEKYVIKPIGSVTGHDIEKDLFKTIENKDTIIAYYTEGKEEWAKNFAMFVDNVLKATGASKVNVVAHSMGGVVVRSAMKYYGVKDKINKIVLLGTPNHPFQDKKELLYMLFYNDPWWMRTGEDWELDVDGYDMRGAGVIFEDIKTGEKGEYLDLLGDYSGNAKIVCIAGTQSKLFVPEISIAGFALPTGSNNDGCVNVGQVFLKTAELNKRIYATHVADKKNIEKSLVGHPYSRYFVRFYIADDMPADSADSLAMMKIK